MEQDRLTLSYIARFRELVKEYAQLERNFSSAADD
jgi:hypothetical protein